jgi:hypothetical protein
LTPTASSSLTAQTQTEIEDFVPAQEVRYLFAMKASTGYLLANHIGASLGANPDLVDAAGIHIDAVTHAVRRLLLLLLLLLLAVAVTVVGFLVVRVCNRELPAEYKVRSEARV